MAGSPERIRTSEPGANKREQPRAETREEIVWSLSRIGVRKGYRDALAGLPFDPDWGRSKKRLALAYEDGRCLGAQARALDRPVSWPRPGAISDELVDLVLCLQSRPKGAP